MPEEDDLEELRQKKMEQLKEQQQQDVDEEAMQAQREQADAQKKAILRQYLSDGARKRLNTVKMSKPEHGEQIERQIIALAQSGRVQDQIDEDQMKQLLSELTPDSQSFNIRRR